MVRKNPSNKNFIEDAQALVEKEIELAKQQGREKTQSFLLLTDIKYKLGKALSKMKKEKLYAQVKNISIK